MHHTKDKGDIGLSAVIFDLTKNNINVCLPLSEHLPFDLIAINNSGKLNRVSVKYRRSKNNAIAFTLRSCWADKNGTHTKYHNKNDYDSIAFYCPDTQKCYYIRILDVKNRSIYIMIKNNDLKTKSSLFADNLTDPNRIFNPQIAEID